MARLHAVKTIGFGCVGMLFGLALSVQAQESMPGKSVVCYGSGVTQLTHTVPNRSALRLQQKQASIDVIYSDFPVEARAAFQEAVATWEMTLNSSVPIRIQATWAALPGNALASTSATKVYRGFAGAVQPDVWYPVALAEKITGRDLNGVGQADINVIINKAGDWYLGTDGNTPATQIDLQSVVLHEIAHGLGFVSAADVKDSTGSLRDDGYLLIYDLLLQTSTGTKVATYPDPSTVLAAQFTSDALYLTFPAAQAVDSATFPRVFAPPFYNRGGSISHLDETTYPPGNPDELMTPYFGNGQSVHTLGSILPGVLTDLGWTDDRTLGNDIVVYPNPGAGLFMIHLPLNSPATALLVFDLNGKTVRTIPAMPAPLSQLDLSDLPVGMYILQLTSPGSDVKRKLILSR